MKHGLAREACRLWAQRDAAQALAFIENGPPGFARRLGPDAVFSVLAGTDPHGALTRDRAWENESERSNIIGAVLRKWATTNPQEAIAFARAEPDAAQRAELVRGTLSALPKDKAWSEAVAFIDLNSPDDRMTLKHILNGWSYQIEEPTAAVLALPAGEGRNDLLQDAAIGAVMSDHQRAEALLEKMPDDASRRSGRYWLREPHSVPCRDIKPRSISVGETHLPVMAPQSALAAINATPMASPAR